MNAMVDTMEDSHADIFQRYGIKFPHEGGDGKVEVELRVNGEVIPFLTSVNSSFGRIFESIDTAVHEKAVELISAARLDKLRRALDDAEWEIGDALRKALKERL